ncbi:TPA: hypothetical protein DF272_02560 [Candidatus Falkowbacteria bacterium]|nr:hypothetical protein [Candidatus Falkowbacteria bacterium]
MSRLPLYKVIKFLHEYNQQNAVELESLQRELSAYGPYSPEQRQAGLTERDAAIQSFDQARAKYLDGQCTHDDYSVAQKSQDEIIQRMLNFEQEKKQKLGRRDHLRYRDGQLNSILRLLIDDQARGDVEIDIDSTSEPVAPIPTPAPEPAAPISPPAPELSAADHQLQNEMLCALYVRRFDKRVCLMNVIETLRHWQRTREIEYGNAFNQLMLLTKESDPRVTAVLDSDGETAVSCALTDTGVKFVINTLLTSVLADLTGMSSLRLIPAWTKRRITFIELIIAIVIDLRAFQHRFLLNQVTDWLKVYVDKHDMATSVYSAVGRSSNKYGAEAKFYHFLPGTTYALSDVGLSIYETRLKPLLSAPAVDDVSTHGAGSAKSKGLKRSFNSNPSKQKRLARALSAKKHVLIKLIRLAAHHLTLKGQIEFNTRQLRDVLLDWSLVGAGSIDSGRLCASIVNHITRVHDAWFRRADNKAAKAKNRLFALTANGIDLSVDDEDHYKQLLGKSDEKFKDLIRRYQKKQSSPVDVLVSVFGLIGELENISFATLVSKFEAGGLTRKQARCFVAKYLHVQLTTEGAQQFIFPVGQHISKSIQNRYALTEAGREMFSTLVNTPN